MEEEDSSDAFIFLNLLRIQRINNVYLYLIYNKFMVYILIDNKFMIGS